MRNVFFFFLYVCTYDEIDNKVDSDVDYISTQAVKFPLQIVHFSLNYNTGQGAVSDFQRVRCMIHVYII